MSIDGDEHLLRAGVVGVSVATLGAVFPPVRALYRGSPFSVRPADGREFTLGSAAALRLPISRFLSLSSVTAKRRSMRNLEWGCAGESVWDGDGRFDECCGLVCVKPLARARFRRWRRARLREATRRLDEPGALAARPDAVAKPAAAAKPEAPGTRDRTLQKVGGRSRVMYGGSSG